MGLLGEAAAGRDGGALLAAAARIRDAEKGRTVTFSKKAFFNVTNLCRDYCAYCTYRSEPGAAGGAMMGPGEVAALARLAAGSRCVEALMVAGERPEERYAEARAWLGERGFSGTAEYLVHCSEAALAEGLFPHTNAGNLERGEMRDLAATNASIGLMLETSSPRLSGEGGPHRMAPSKDPAARMRVLRDAGDLGIPVTTGLLLGIGEDCAEAVDSLLAVRGLHARRGNIQEVILQNFRPKPGTPMRSRPPAGARYLAAVAALARVLMPGMNLQVPPNLLPGSYHEALRSGINDWGGISPLTPDHVNPEFAWPRIRDVEERTARAGLRLKCRFPVYPEHAGSAPRALRDRMRAVADGEGHVAERRWRGPE